MRIERLLIKNYRQFKNVEVCFQKTSAYDLHVVIAKNGAGKSNFLNAVNWCLYGDEPHLSNRSEQLPIINLDTIYETPDGKDQKVEVQLKVKTADGKDIIFTREEVYKIYDRYPNDQADDQPTKQEVLQTRNFEVQVNVAGTDWEILEGENAKLHVERFVPKNIRQYFFFDNEQLDRYFRDDGTDIRTQTFQISNIDLLASVERKLNTTLIELTREMGRGNKDVDSVGDELERYKEDLASIEDRLKDESQQFADAKEKIQDLNAKLEGKPDIDKYEEELKTLANKERSKKALLDDKVKERQDLLLDYSKIIMLCPAINNASNTIDVKREKREIPPPVDPSFLKKILELHECSICGQHLNRESEERISELLAEFEQTTIIGKPLNDMDYPLRQLRDRHGAFKEKLRKVNDDIEVQKQDLADIEMRTDEIHRIESAHPKEVIQEWSRQRKEYASIYDTTKETIGRMKERRDGIRDDIAKAEQRLQRMLQQREKSDALAKQALLCKQAFDTVTAVKEAIMADTRKKIEAETRDLFLNLIWKKHTFKDVRISDDYNVELIHARGYSCLGSTSAGERELLALAFIRALHEVSGFDSPILIDTPVARLSDTNRENFAEALIAASTEKQIILIFSFSEYSDDISKPLDLSCSTKTIITLAPGESEALMEAHK